MKALMVMFDSLNRHMLPPYGCNWTVAPNFTRLAKRSVTFETSYVCSMPCMPARRDLHTGRPNFLHRAWGPLEPYDDSVPEMLSKAGVYTHLASDHYHYWEDGGANYHCRYNSWECFRGQEGDSFIGQVKDPVIPPTLNSKGRRADWVNREHIVDDAQYPQTQTFDAGLKFIDRNHDQDNWFLQIECFDPHEPFTTDPRFRDLYPRKYAGPLFDWPNYDRVKEPPDAVEEARLNYAALLSKCDQSLGRVLDAMDRHDLWKDTLLIVWTDHGLLLGEHGWWAKIRMPFYEEIARTPFFMWDPRLGGAGERRTALVQPSIDLGPTLLEFFNVPQTDTMLGQPLRPVIESDTPIREAGIFGVHGGQLNVTDGRYVYMRGYDPTVPLINYTLMPASMRDRWGPEQLSTARLAKPFDFTKGMPLLATGPTGPVPPPPPGSTWLSPECQSNLLWDIQSDPTQSSPINNPSIEDRMCAHLRTLLTYCDAPSEMYTRYDLPHP